MFFLTNKKSYFWMTYKQSVERLNKTQGFYYKNDFTNKIS